MEEASNRVHNVKNEWVPDYLHFKNARGNKTLTMYLNYEAAESKLLTSPFDLRVN